MKLYNNFKVKIIIKKEEQTIDFGCGVRQGDNLAGIIFNIVIQLAAEEVAKNSNKAKLT